MHVRIKRIDKSLPLPIYGTPGAAAVDLYAREDYEIQPKSLGAVPSNLIVATPPGYAFIVVPRSSTPRKKGLLIPHGIGIIDPDFFGSDDEILLQFYNFTDEVVKIKKGERIAQGFFIKVEHAEWEEIENIEGPSRGGFGSSG